MGKMEKKVLGSEGKKVSTVNKVKTVKASFEGWMLSIAELTIRFFF